jgi:hypothetical protein
MTHTDGRPIEPRKHYTVVLNDFLLAGGSGAAEVVDTVPDAAKQVYQSRLLRDEIAKYLQGLPAPVNTPERPLVRPASPPIVMEGPPPPHPAAHQQLICR